MLNMATDIKVISLNVKGLRQYKKRRKIFNWCHKHGGDKCIYFLQETHGSKDIEKSWSNQWRGDIYFAHGTTQSKGVLTMASEKLQYTLNSEILDPMGRFVIIDINVGESNFLLINTYAPNTEVEQVEFFNTITKAIEKYSEENKIIIWGGDFNFCFDIMDVSDCSAHFKKRSITLVKNIMESYDLCDIWRVRNPQIKVHTWRTANISIQRRIDFS